MTFVLSSGFGRSLCLLNKVLSLFTGLCATSKLCFFRILAVISEIWLMYGREIRLVVASSVFVWVVCVLCLRL